MSTFDGKSIKDRIQRAARHELDLSDKTAAEVAFHMSDWLDDLEAYVRFCSKPDALTDKQLSELLMAFLLHVPNHLAAAARLYTGSGVADVFDVGATSDETDE